VTEVCQVDHGNSRRCANSVVLFLVAAPSTALVRMN